jgi:hypothetical protein
VELNDNVRQVLSQPEGTVVAAHVRRIDPPQFVAETVDDLFEGMEWSGEQCDNCGCYAYTVKRIGPLPEWHPHAWVVECDGDPDEAEEWARDGAGEAQVKAVHEGCHTQYTLQWLSESEVCF